MLIVDSREKWTHPGSSDTHISGWLDRHGIKWVVKKLDVGDYMLEGGTITIDRKQSLDEISKNLTNAADKKRFWNEVRLAHHRGLKLVVLIESGKFREIADIGRWRSEYTGVSGYVVYRRMERLRRSYGVEFVLCQRRSVAKKIMEILRDE